MELLLCFMLGLLATSIGVLAQSDCLQNLPPFFGRLNRPRLPNRIQAIVPNYTFGCHGRVFRWGACVEPGGRNQQYILNFQVWRLQKSGQESFFSLIGSNFGQNLRPTSRCVILDVSENDWIEVEPGDVVGFYSEHISQRGSGGGVAVDSSSVGVTTWYREEVFTCQDSLNNACRLSIGPAGDLQSSERDGAPIITAAVEVLVPPVPTTVAATPTNRVTSNTHIVTVMASSTVSGSTSVAADDMVQTPTAIPLSESVTVPTSESILQPSSNLHAIIQTSLQSIAETPTVVVNSTQDELAIGTIIGGAVAGLVVAILATLIAVWTILFVRRRQMTTAHISREPQPEVSTRKRALTRPIYGDRELASDATSIRNEDNIKVSHNASYITNTAAIPISQNEAYGTLQTDDSREHGFDSKKHPSVYYDYVDSKTGRH